MRALAVALRWVPRRKKVSRTAVLANHHESKSAMSCCAPKNLRYCPRDTCRKCTVPTYAFPDQPNIAAVALSEALSINGVLSSGDPIMRHQEPFLLLGGTAYAHYGTPFLHLGSNESLSFTAHPLMPLSEAFYFRAHKYPVGGVDVAPDGSVPYQSNGAEIREGDTIFLTAMIGGHVLAQWQPPSAYALPYFNVPQKDALDNWARYGTQSGETMRIVSDTFDPRLSPNEQPVVRLDGTKAYQFQFTRIGQNLAVLPGATPAPCQVRLSQFMGGPTRLIPFAPILFYQQDRQQPVNGANGMTGETTPSGEPAAVPNAVAVNSVNGNGNSAAANNANSTNAADLDAEGAAAAQAANETAAMAEEAAGVAEEAAANGDVNTAVNASNASTRASQVANDAAGTANSIAASTKSAAANNAAASANNAAKRAINAASNAFNAAKNAVNIANANAAANAP